MVAITSRHYADIAFHFSHCDATSLKGFQSINCRITEYREVEGTNKDHWVQLLSPHRNTQNFNAISKSIVQTLREIQQAWDHDHCPGEPTPVPKCPLSEEGEVKNLFLIPRSLFCSFYQSDTTEVVSVEK